MFSKPSLTPSSSESGRTPSVTAIALERIARGPDQSKFVIAGGRIEAASPSEDAQLIEASMGMDSHESDAAELSRLILENAEANLLAGIRFLDKQNDCLRQISEKLGDAARLWKISRIPNVESKRLETIQFEFQSARDEVEELRQATYRSVPLFSDGQSSPLRIHHPSRREWQLLLIDRCDLGTASLTTFAHGKIYGDQTGFFLDLETIENAHGSLRNPLSNNIMQLKLLHSCLSGVKRRLENDEESSPSQTPTLPSSRTTNLFRTLN